MAEISGGDKLENALQELAHKLGRGGEVKIGYLQNAHYPDGKSVALIGALNEFGSTRAPPRPSLRASSCIAFSSLSPPDISAIIAPR